MGEPVQAVISVKCQLCSNTSTVIAKQDDLVSYAGGELVQKIWPDESSDFREVIIGWRSNYYVCSDCYDWE